MKYFLFVFCILTLKCIAQTPFDKGFKTGFSEGYCYNQTGCIAPIPPLSPIPRLNENISSYQDGYLNGFLTGKSLREHNIIRQNNVVNITPNYREPTRPQSYQTNGYVNPVDLNLMREVLQYKQNLFDTRADWTQERINGLTTLNHCLLSIKQKGLCDTVTSQINSVVNFLNSRPINFSDTNLFNSIAQNLWQIEQNIFNNYKP